MLDGKPHSLDEVFHYLDRAVEIYPMRHLRQLTFEMHASVERAMKR